MARRCTTHHYACDCREEKFAEIKKQLAASERREKGLEDAMEKGCHTACTYLEADKEIINHQIDVRKEIEAENLDMRGVLGKIAALLEQDI